MEIEGKFFEIFRTNGNEDLHPFSHAHAHKISSSHFQMHIFAKDPLFPFCGKKSICRHGNPAAILSFAPQKHFSAKIGVWTPASFCIISFIRLNFLHLFLQVLQSMASSRLFPFGSAQEEFHLFQIYLLFLLFVCAMLTIAKTLS